MFKAKAKAKDLQKKQGQGQGQEILKANTKDIQKPLPQRHITMKNIQCSICD